MLVQFGFFVAWVYLRFFKLSENGDFRGDRSETFAFQCWFPPPVRYVHPAWLSVERLIEVICLHGRPYIAIAGNHVYKMAVRVGLVQAWEEPAGYSVLPGPGQARAEAERRRSVLLLLRPVRRNPALQAVQLPVTLKSARPGKLTVYLRALALKALDARLASGSPAPPAVSPGVPSIPGAGPPPSAASTVPAPAPPLRSSASSKTVPTAGPEDAKEAKD